MWGGSGVFDPALCAAAAAPLESGARGPVQHMQITTRTRTRKSSTHVWSVTSFARSPTQSAADVRGPGTPGVGTTLNAFGFGRAATEEEGSMVDCGNEEEGASRTGKAGLKRKEKVGAEDVRNAKESSSARVAAGTGAHVVEQSPGTT